MTSANFFWRGNDFGFLENIVLKSHLKVGHVPILWLSGMEPKGPYWDEIQQMLQVKDADTV